MSNLDKLTSLLHEGQAARDLDLLIDNLERPVRNPDDPNDLPYEVQTAPDSVEEISDNLKDESRASDISGGVVNESLDNLFLICENKEDWNDVRKSLKVDKKTAKRLNLTSKN